MPGSLKASNSTRRIIDKYSLSKSHNNLSTHFDEEEAQNDVDVLDYFGFYHPDGLTHRDQEAEHKYRKKDVKRVDKWMKFIQNNGFESFYQGRPKEELIRRVFKGIPPRIRPRVWPILLNVAAAKKERVYDDMRKYAFASSTYIEQIDLDINRTFRSTTFFNESFGPRQQVLFRILAAYSMYNTEIGYCQGMSDIAGMLLIYIMDEEEAFWAFAQLLDGPRHKMHCLFVRDFPGLRRYFSHHDRVLKTHLHKVWKHFRKEQVETCTYAFKWYMQCFLGRLPISLSLRIWDIYLLEGEKAMVAMAYNILKMHKQRLLRMDQMQILAFLQDEISRDFGFDDDDVIDSLKDCLEDLRRSNMETPPPLTADMLPTKPMGQASAIWEVRHSDEEDRNKSDQQQNKSRSRKSETEDSVAASAERDSLLRSDQPTPISSFKSGKLGIQMRKPLNSTNSSTGVSSRHHSPHSTDSRRRLHLSQQSLTSTRSVITSPRIATDTSSGPNTKQQHHSFPKQHNESHTPKMNSKPSIATNMSASNSIRRSRNETSSPIQSLTTKTGPNGLQDADNVWFVPSGTGYNNNSDALRVEDRRNTRKSSANANLDLPPKDYKSVTSKSTEDSDSPWTQAQSLAQPHRSKDKSTKVSSNSKAIVDVNFPGVSKDLPKSGDSSPLWTKKPSYSASPSQPKGVTKVGKAEFYLQASSVQHRPAGSGSSAFLRNSNSSSVSSRSLAGGGDVRWSVHGTVSVLPLEMPPRVCSPLYTPSPSPRSYQFHQYH
ncbi:hypothetical protein Aperf_G00000118295 [Anoplocephala perfoliata]